MGALRATGFCALLAIAFATTASAQQAQIRQVVAKACKTHELEKHTAPRAQQTLTKPRATGTAPLSQCR